MLDERPLPGPQSPWIQRPPTAEIPATRGVVGPYARLLTVTNSEPPRFAATSLPNLKSANSRVLLLRTAVAKASRDGSYELDERPGAEWAVQHRLGADGSADLLGAARARRMAAAGSLIKEKEGQERKEKHECTAIALHVQTPFLIGTGSGGIRDLGMTVHGTYGWPILPGSSLKGAACAYARSALDLPPATLETVFGCEPSRTHEINSTSKTEVEGPASPSKPEPTLLGGGVQFLDALPASVEFDVTIDVLTPHQGRYYETSDAASAPPAEYFQPVPVNFLVVSSGIWVALLVGESKAVQVAVKALRGAVCDEGLGAKTSAGYGYFQVGRTRTIRGGKHDNLPSPMRNLGFQQHEDWTRQA